MTLEDMNRDLMESAGRDILEINQIDIEIKGLTKQKQKLQESANEKLGIVKVNLEMIRMAKG